MKLLAEIEKLKDDLSSLTRSKEAEFAAERAKEMAERAQMEAALAETHAKNKVQIQNSLAKERLNFDQ